MTTIALVGNPNSGKTTLFNALTGTRQRVGNWPGVTVERKSGRYFHSEDHIEVVDLPGTYSIDPVSNALDERIAREYITAAGDADSESGPDLLVNVIDATSLARGLYLTTELLELARPVVVALNMIDVANRHGMNIDAERLGAKLGCPVIPLVASREKGIDALKDAVQTTVGRTRANPARANRRADSVQAGANDRYLQVDTLLADCLQTKPTRRSVTDRLDSVVLN
ncbi:MAG: 50S ribosome-binding GTPase, partial [Gammaproteobacteria bacterium]|nr:50S ribosome-binding GTPase [Gammaproteobacteria bacterium]